MKYVNKCWLFKSMNMRLLFVKRLNMCYINGGERCIKFEMSCVFESDVIKHLLMYFEHG